MISEYDFQSVFDAGVLRKNKEELQLLQLGVEAETYQSGWCVLKTACTWLGRCYVCTGFGARAHYARELYNCNVILSTAHFQNTTVSFLSCISALYFWFPLSAAEHCLTGNGILRYNYNSLFEVVFQHINCFVLISSEENSGHRTLRYFIMQMNCKFRSKFSRLFYASFDINSI